MTFLMDENGQGMVEYALILGLISLAAVAILALFGPKIGKMYSKSVNEVAKAD